MTIHGAIPPEYQNVTDTNVGKMTEKEAIAIMQSEIRCNSGTIGDIDELCRLCNHTNECDEGTFNDILKSALNMAIEALQFQQKLEDLEVLG